MAFSEKITPIVVGIATVFAVCHIVLSSYSAADLNWIHFKVQGIDQGLREAKNRTRGLTLECLDNVEGSCQALERDDALGSYANSVHSVLRLRTSAFAMPLVSSSLTGLTFLIGLIVFFVFRKKPFRRQTLLLVMGVINWISALSSFIGLIVYLESQNQEAYKYDPNLATARASWTEAVRLQTTEHFGYAFGLAIGSCVSNHLATFLLFTASLWV